MDYNKLKKEFNDLDADSQWIWLVNCPFKDRIKITLDNDSTDFCFVDIPESDNPGLFYFKSDIGNRYGAASLLEALKFKVEYC